MTVLAVGLVSHFGVKFWCISPHLHFITTLLFLSFSNGKRIKFLVFSKLEAGKPNISSCISGALENVSMSALGRCRIFWEKYLEEHEKSTLVSGASPRTYLLQLLLPPFFLCIGNNNNLVSCRDF